MTTDTIVAVDADSIHRVKDGKVVANRGEIKTDVLVLAEEIKKGASLDEVSGVMTVSSDLYESLLPNGLTVSTIKEVQQFNANMAAAGLKALGELSIPVMKRNKDLAKTTLDIQAVGKDVFNYQFERSRPYPDRDNPGEVKHKFGSGQVGFTMYGAGSRGDVKKVKEELSDAAMTAFGNL